MRDPQGGSAPDGGSEVDGTFRAAGLFTWLLSLIALGQLFVQSYQARVLQISLRWQATLALGAVALAATGALLAFAQRASVRRAILAWKGRTDGLTQHWVVNLGLIALAAAAYPVLVFGIASRYLGGLFPRLLLFWLIVLAVSALLRRWLPGAPWRERLVAAAIGYGLIVRALAFVPEVSSYPFSLGWSEASRYYYASLFDSRDIYGLRLNLPELHPTRYFLQSLPFIVADLPLWFHRLWQVLLWWLLPLTTAALIVARHPLVGRWTRLLVGGWIVLYLFQGPVYYHLLVMVVMVLAGVDVRRPGRSTLIVVAASMWAGLSRINWYPVPGLLAGSLYLMEAPAEPRSHWTALRWPIAWTLMGTLAALASQAAYVRLTGIDVDRFTSSLSSDLLFYRLLPNPTHAWGILPAILVASASLVLNLWWSRSAWLRRIDGWRAAFLGAALLVLLVGGLLVSLKIGGGSNLHNLDAYLVLLLLVGASWLRPTGDAAAEPAFRSTFTLPSFRRTALLVAVPLVFAVSSGSRWIERDFTAAQVALGVIRDQAQTAAQRGEAVLFISQRHLLTFGLVPGVPLEPEYEAVFLMEMAMSENEVYLGRFHALLEGQAFGLVVVDRLSMALQGPTHNFGEENDAWVREVSLPLLCWYQLSIRLERPPVDLLIPKTDGAACPG